MTLINSLAFYGHQSIGDIHKLPEWRIPKMIEDLEKMLKNAAGN